MDRSCDKSVKSVSASSGLRIGFDIIEDEVEDLVR